MYLRFQTKLPSFTYFSSFVAVISCQLSYNNVVFVHNFQPKPIDTQVITHHMQRYAVWFGGSMLASTVSEIHPQV